MPIYKIAHLTSVHPRWDTRIFVKMCCSLKESDGFTPILVVADGEGSGVKNGVSILDVGKTTGGRLRRMTLSAYKVYREALRLDADIYHLHDPELIPFGLLLKKRGKKVIFDAHEDLPQQVLSKPYLNTFSKKMLSNIIKIFERVTCSSFDALITATPFIREKFKKINRNSVDINNFPIIDEICPSGRWEDKKNEVVYVGALATIRGVVEMVKSLNYAPNVRLNLGGKFGNQDYEAKVRAMEEWRRVNELGFLSRVEVVEVLSRSKAGLVVLHPTSNYIDSLPVKMFEYMAAGIPVIASDFPLWKSIIEENRCGLCVDPLDPVAVGNAICFIVENPHLAQKMGEAGRLCVVEKFNWKVEEKKLFALYHRILNN